MLNHAIVVLLKEVYSIIDVIVYYSCFMTLCTIVLHLFLFIKDLTKYITVYLPLLGILICTMAVVLNELYSIIDSIMIASCYLLYLYYYIIYANEEYNTFLN